jgi:hypothetical protein
MRCVQRQGEVGGREGVGVEESCLSKSSSCVDKAVEKETFAVRNDDPTVSNA